MKVNEFLVILHSAAPERLITFYRDVVGLTSRPEIEPGAFMAGSSDFVSVIIEPHSEVAPSAREPERSLLNFVVDDARSEQARLEANGVSFIRSATEEAGVGIFATFTDPDGNFCQLVEFT
jgi:predicted enzyme related to lactoylglutathione lyase